MPTNITATDPVSVAGTSGQTYDQWYMTQLIVKANPSKAMTVVHLNRCAEVNGAKVLMPNDGSGKNEISFTFDVWKEMQNTPELAAAMQSVVDAVTAYATKKGLL